MRAPLGPLVALLVAGCAGPQPLQVIDNILSHEALPPPAPALVREFLARPLAAQDAAAIFERSVPAALLGLAEAVPESPGPPVTLQQFLEPYLLELAAARRALQTAAPALGELPAALPTPALQRELAAKIDRQAMQRVAGMFLEATARFAHAVRAARGRILFPEGGARIAFAGGTVVIGTGGDDVHERTPVQKGEVFVIIDPGGDDHYRGSDIVLHGLSAILDFGGNDRYESEGPAWAAAVAGVSLLLDIAGDDTYAAGDFAQGAATSNGVGILIDRGGRNEWYLEQPSGWGRAQWSRGLPSLGLVLADAPRADTAVVHEPEAEGACPPPGPVAPDVLAKIARLRADDFDALWPLAFALRCELAEANETQAQSMWDAFEGLVAGPYAGIAASALRARPAPPEQMRRLVGQLSDHPSCGVRTAALSLDGTVAAAQAALRSSCWRLQARALRILRDRGVAPEDTRAVPDFLLQSLQAGGKRSASSRAP